MLVDKFKRCGEAVQIVQRRVGKVGEKVRKNQFQRAVGRNFRREGVFAVIMHNEGEQVIGCLHVHLVALLGGKRFKKVFGKDIGYNMDKIVPHVVVARTLYDGKGGDKVQISLFKVERAVNQSQARRTGADVVDAHMKKFIYHVVPLFADVEVACRYNIHFCRLKKIIKVIHIIFTRFPQKVNFYNIVRKERERCQAFKK